MAIFSKDSIKNIFCIFYNIYSCAAIRAPSGGLKDIIPPVLLYSLPKSGSVNFKGQNIELFFSEYLSEKSIDNSITILPDINNLYKIKYKGYLDREYRFLKKMINLDQILIPEDINFEL